MGKTQWRLSGIGFVIGSIEAVVVFRELRWGTVVVFVSGVTHFCLQGPLLFFQTFHRKRHSPRERAVDSGVDDFVLVLGLWSVWFFFSVVCPCVRTAQEPNSSLNEFPLACGPPSLSHSITPVRGRWTRKTGNPSPINFFGVASTLRFLVQGGAS